MSAPPLADPRCRFFLGTHEVSWAGRTAVRLFLSRRRLARQKSHPVALGFWALDSGGFTELDLHGCWTVPPEVYVEEVRVYSGRLGRMSWAATQDWMCEDKILKKTGLTVQEHQRRTVASYLRLRQLAPEIPWSPAVQGWSVADYVQCVRMYEAEGVDLRTVRLVGVGSVCRRQHTDEAVEIFKTLHSHGLRLHGFGLKLTGLRKAAQYLRSADSLAWSYGARRAKTRLPGCKHRGACGNCMAYALSWRDKVLTIPGVW